MNRKSWQSEKAVGTVLLAITWNHLCSDQWYGPDKLWMLPFSLQVNL